MRWGDDALAREKYLHAAEDVFDTVPAWNQHFYNDYAQEGAAYLAISASDPENLKGVDSSRIIRSQKSSSEALKPFYRLQMQNAFPWCIASIPIPSWAEKVFPGQAGRCGAALERHFCGGSGHRRRHGSGAMAVPSQHAGAAQTEAE